HAAGETLTVRYRTIIVLFLWAFGIFPFAVATGLSGAFLFRESAMTSGRLAVRASGLLTALIAAISFVGCANDKIVFRDRQPFNNPPAAALGFLGYYDAATKQTTCGNCHAEIQGSWKATKHASAWANLN